MNPQTWLKDRTIFRCLSGSHAYGLNTPESDEDIRGVCIPPLEYFFNLNEFEQYVQTKVEDITIFGIKKFFKLALDCNPNILELLFMPEDCILQTSTTWELIEDIRHLFLSKKVKHTYTGYAFSQIKRVKTHRAWLLNPPKKQPERKDFDLPSHVKMPAEIQGAIANLEEHEIEEALKTLPSVIMALYNKERSYKNALNNWKQYQTWLTSRNPARAELEAKFGYDTKHMSHTMRLLIQGTGILTDGTFTVRLDPANKDFCLSIRQGEFSYEDLMEMSEKRIAHFDFLYERSALPYVNDKVKVGATMQKILEGYFYPEIISRHDLVEL